MIARVKLARSGRALNGTAALIQLPVSGGRRNLKAVLLASATGVLLLSLIGQAARAADGDGGKADGANGGAASVDGTGVAGVSPSANYLGAGGGGSGGIGGAGGSSNNGTRAGGAGATTPGGNGQNGAAGAVNIPGAGGGGGAHGFVGTTADFSGAGISGGNGGDGGSGSLGGGGGGGGFGAVVTGISDFNGSIGSGASSIGGAGGGFGRSATGGNGGSGFVLYDMAGENIITLNLNAHGGDGGISIVAGGASGSGGNGGTGVVVLGGAARTTLSVTGTAFGGGGGNGANGDNGLGGAGGAGGGGLLISGTTGINTVTTSAEVRGGDGGNGGNGGSVSVGSRGGVGGAGGHGVAQLSVVGTTNLVITADVAGGAGGNGGNGGNSPNSAQNGGNGAAGGKGGDGLMFIGSPAASVVTIGADVTGGAGGVGGIGGAGGSSAQPGTNGAAGTGGAGVRGERLTAILDGASASVTGGLGGDGARAPAIAFVGGLNTLELRASVGGALPTFNGAITHGGADGDNLRLGGVNDATFALGALEASGQYDGFGGLEKRGTSTWTLTGTTTSTASWNVQEGTLALSSDASISTAQRVIVFGTLDISGTSSGATINYLVGSPTGTIVLGERDLTVNQTTAGMFAGAISGSGTFIKSGTASLDLTGNSSGFTGTTAVTVGTLALHGTSATPAILGGNVTVADGATFQGFDATVTGLVTVNSGGTLTNSTTNASAGGVTMGSLVLNAGAQTTVGLDTPSIDSAIFTVTGALTVNGMLNVVGLPGYGDGVYRVFSSGAPLTDNGLVLGTSPDGFSARLETGTSTVDVVVGAPEVGLQFWSMDGATRGGGGTWTSTNPWLSEGGTTAPWAGLTGVFTGAAGVVSVEGTQAFGTLEFLTSGYVIQAGAGGTLDLGAGGRLWAEGANVVATVAAPITGAGALTKIGAGTIVLSGTNSYSGGTVLSAGTLQVSADANLGAASGGLTFVGGTLATTATFASARVVTLEAAGGTVDVSSGTSLTLSGTISGEGGLTKAGEGVLVLTGTGSYAGLTTINAGTLQIGNGGTAGTITGDVVNNAALAFNRSDTYTFPGTISGPGSVSFLGGGTVLFSSPGAYAGPISVTNTTVQLEAGSTSGSTFTLGAGGIIGGNGTIGGLVVNSGGIAAPGNSPGTIVVNGPVTFSAGGQYRVDVTPAGGHDLITATGPVTISNGASVQVVATTGVYADAQYAILTTTGDLTGTFGSVTANYAFLTPVLSYDAQNVYLTLTAGSSATFASYAQTINQLNVANAAQVLGAGNSLYDAVLALPVGAVPGAFNALSGEIYPSSSTVIEQQSVYVRDAVTARLRQAVTVPGASPLGYAAKAAGPATAQLGPDLAPTLWAQGYGGWGDTFSNGNAASVSNSIGGFLIGADVALLDTVRAGVFGGFSRSSFDVDARNSSGSMDNYDIGLYAGAQFGAFALRGGLSYSWHDVSVDRTVAFPGLVQLTSAGYTTGSTQVFGEVGYDVAFGAYAFEPFAGLAYVNVDGGSFSETGGSAALTVSKRSMDTLYTTLGVRLATSLKLAGLTLTPTATLGWQHAFGDTTPAATMLFAGGTTPFSVAGVPIAEDTLLVGAGLSAALSGTTTLSVNYTGQIASEASQNAFTAQFSMKF